MRARPIALLIIAAVLLVAGASAAPEGESLLWVRRTGAHEEREIVLLSDGSVVVSGSFEGTAVFGAGEPGETTLVAEGTDRSLARYRPDGTLVWAQRVHTPNALGWEAIAALPGGGFLAADGAAHEIVFAPDGPQPVVWPGVPGDSNSHLLLAAYGADGSLLWTREAAVAEEDVNFDPWDVHAAGDRIVVAGLGEGEVVFDPGLPTEATLNLPEESAGGWIAWLEADGTLIEAKGYDSAGSAVREVRLLADGSTIAAGIHDEALTLGAGEPNETALVPAGDHDIFLAKFDPDRKLEWARGIENDEMRGNDGLAVHSDGTSVISGPLRSSMTLGAGEPGETTLTPEGAGGVFFAGYAADGSLRWARRTGDAGNVIGYHLAPLADGGFAMSGSLTGSVTFGPGEAAETTLSNARGVGASFLATWDSRGRLLSVREVTEYPYVPELVEGPDRSLVIVGYGPDMHFGEGEPTETFLTGPEAGYIAKFRRGVPGGGLTWARSTAGIRDEDVATAADGEILTTGLFEGEVSFGHGDPGAVVRTSAGGTDVFVTKYTEEGDLHWVRAAGGTGEDAGMAVAAGADGEVYVAGRFAGTSTFGAGTVRETTLTSGAEEDVFLAAWSSIGTFQWAVGAGGEYQDVPYDVAVTADGRIAVTGHFKNEAVFGAGEVGETRLDRSGEPNLFVACYEADGTLAWARQAELAAEGASAFGYGVAATPDGGVVVTGTFRSEVRLGEVLLQSAGGEDVLVAKYDGDGDLLWAKRAGSSGKDGGRGASALYDGSVVVTGQFAGEATFGAGEADETTLTSAGEGDVFLAEYAGNGLLRRVRQAGGAGHDYGTAVHAVPDGSYVAVGRFSGTAVFGPGETFEAALVAPVGDSMFVARTFPGGNLAWARRADRPWPTGVTVLPDWTAVAAGSLTTTPTVFGPGEPNETTIEGSQHGFLARYGTPLEDFRTQLSLAKLSLRPNAKRPEKGKLAALLVLNARQEDFDPSEPVELRIGNVSDLAGSSTWAATLEAGSKPDSWSFKGEIGGHDVKLSLAFDDASSRATLKFSAKGDVSGLLDAEEAVRVGLVAGEIFAWQVVRLRVKSGKADYKAGKTGLSLSRRLQVTKAKLAPEKGTFSLKGTIHGLPENEIAGLPLRLVVIVESSPAASRAIGAGDVVQGFGVKMKDRDAGEEGAGKIAAFVFKASSGQFTIKGKGFAPAEVENPVAFRIRLLDREGQPIYDRVATLGMEEKGGVFVY